jgi:flavodoxin
MKALVVYESMFGNTEDVARAVASGLARHMDVDVLDVTDAPHEIDQLLDLIVVGGPTHAFSMTRLSTREDAVRQGATHGSPTLGLREWLEHQHAGPHSELVATFDTRIDKVRHLPGSAAKKAAHVAHRIGYRPAARPMSFYVRDTSGPLVEGELARAEEWGDQLGADAEVRAHGRIPSSHRR